MFRRRVDIIVTAFPAPAHVQRGAEPRLGMVLHLRLAQELSGSGGEYRLMLVDGATFAPLCDAWENERK